LTSVGERIEKMEHNLLTPQPRIDNLDSFQYTNGTQKSTFAFVQESKRATFVKCSVQIQTVTAFAFSGTKPQPNFNLGALDL
jgi:hypothetical protein